MTLSNSNILSGKSTPLQYFFKNTLLENNVVYFPHVYNLKGKGLL